MTEEPEDPTAGLLSIGDVADAVAISVDTIRVWERRYGRPVPVRLPSGHRRYCEEDVRWLRRIAEALARGHRPSRVVPLDDDELDALLSSETPADETYPPRWMDLVRGFRREALRRALEKETSNLSLRDFLNLRVAPFVNDLGREWADGGVAIRHEHFASALLTDFLTSLRESRVRSPDGPVMVLATLSGEQHGIGLQMAALVADLAGVRTSLLGLNTPNEEIVKAAQEVGARAVGISVSLATGGVRTDRELRALRALLPEEVALIVGGQGARGVRRGPRDIDYVESLDELADRLASL